MTDWIERTPATPGWYATTRCWDPSEGFIPGADYWTGEKWESDGHPVVCRSLAPFATQELARAWACVHDIEQ